MDHSALPRRSRQREGKDIREKFGRGPRPPRSFRFLFPNQDRSDEYPECDVVGDLRERLKGSDTWEATSDDPEVDGRYAQAGDGSFQGWILARENGRHDHRPGDRQPEMNRDGRNHQPSASRLPSMKDGPGRNRRFERICLDDQGVNGRRKSTEQSGRQSSTKALSQVWVKRLRRTPHGSRLIRTVSRSVPISLTKAALTGLSVR